MTCRIATSSVRRVITLRLATLALVALACLAVPACERPTGGAQARRSILNVSYDPTRELYSEINAAFVQHWRQSTGESVEVKQSHGGSGKQARSVIDGLEADLVSLALEPDVDAIYEKAGLLPADWRTRFSRNSAPYTSTIVLVVRKGNPRQIKDWDGLAAPGLAVISPNPKTSGGARWNYLAAWGYQLRRNGGDQADARAFVARIFSNVPVLDTGARGATNTFVQRGLGDVLISWESDALLVVREFPDQGLEIVYPSLSIRAEPPVAVVEKVAARRGSTDLATGYIDFLYSRAGQEIIGRHFFRPGEPEVFESFHDRFKPIPLFTIDELFGGWKQAQKEHFDEGGTFDQIKAERAG